MNEQELHTLLEVQYLIGRIDELQTKAMPNISNLHKSRMIDQRIEKYYNKLKKTSEIAYHMFSVEKKNRDVAKQKSKLEMKSLLEECLDLLPSGPLYIKVKDELKKF
jgi:hypothetical protein